MTLEEALKIIDPDTCHDALAVYAGDCDMLHAKAVEASRIVVDVCTAAVRDLNYVAKNSQSYDCSCALCTGGMGTGICDWPDDVDMPIDACEKCGKCRCSKCSDRSEWDWNKFWRYET